MSFGPFLHLQVEIHTIILRQISPTSNIFPILRKLASKTRSRKRPSISLIQNRSFDFIWPPKLFIEMSQEMFSLPSNFKMGTLALEMNCSLCHPPAKWIETKFNQEVLYWPYVEHIHAFSANFKFTPPNRQIFFGSDFLD